MKQRLCMLSYSNLRRQGTSLDKFDENYTTEEIFEEMSKRVTEKLHGGEFMVVFFFVGELE